MIESYQEREALLRERVPPRDCCLARVQEVYQEGLTLLFDGEDTPRKKKFAYNAAISFSKGQRVRVEKINGAYVVAYPIKGGNV